MRKKEVFNVTFSSIMVSFAVVLEVLFKFVFILQMPNGGGISLAMLPLVVCSIVCGWQYGLMAGLSFGLLDCFVIDGYSFNLASFVLDYLIAFMSVSLAAIFRKKILAGKKIYFVWAFLIVILVRFVSSGFSGVINAYVWGYDQAFLEGIFGVGKGSVGWLYLYSFIIYNLPYLAVTALCCILVGMLGYKVIFLKYSDYYFD